MRKSQMAAALALAYVTGSVIAPVSNIYAEPVRKACDPSVADDLLGVIAGDEIDAIIANIKTTLPVYNLYKVAVDLKAEYSAVEENGKTKAQNIDDAVVKAKKDLDDANTAVGTANSKLNNNLANAATIVKNLINEGKAPEQYTTPENFADLISDAEEKVPFYAEYQTLIKAVVSKNVEDIQNAARALNTARVNKGYDPEFSMTDDVLKSADFNDILTSLSDRALHPAYSSHKTIFDIALKVEAIKAAEVEAAEAEDAYNENVGRQKEVVDAVNKVMSDLRDAGVKVKNTAERTTAQGAISLITEAFQGIPSNIIIEGYDKWSAFVSYLEKAAESDVKDKNLYDGIKSELAKVTDTATVEKIFAPILANRTVCDADKIVAVEGNLPLYRFMITVDEAAGIDDKAFEGKEQIAYKIKFYYNNEELDSENWNWDKGGYKVIVNVPEEMKGETVSVYYVEDDIRELRESSFDAENNTITFKADHFSTYVLVGENNFGGYDDDNQFNDPIYTDRVLFNDQYGVAIYGNFRAEGDYKVRVTPIADRMISDDEEFNGMLEEATQVFYRVEVFEVIDGKEVRVDLNGQTVTIAIALPSVMDADKDVYVYFGEEDSDKMTRVENAIFDGNFIMFATDKLGDYDLIQFVEKEVVTPGEEDKTEFIPAAKPSVSTPNTGISVATTEAVSANTAATTGFIAGFLAVAGAAVAAIVRRASRKA